jgi:glutathione S-transferase
MVRNDEVEEYHMLTLYYSPGACSLASHITLEESKAQYEPKPVIIAKGEHKTEDYLTINPRGKVPALGIEDGQVITENVAILTYVAHRFPSAALMPTDALAEARCLSTMAWLSNTVHPSFTHIFRPEAYSEDPAAHPGIKEIGKKTYWRLLEEADRLMADRQWIQGDRFTTCDPYMLVFYHWGVRTGFPMENLKCLTPWKDRMLRRTAVLTILRRENNTTLLKA